MHPNLISRLFFPYYPLLSTSCQKFLNRLLEDGLLTAELTDGTGAGETLRLSLRSERGAAG